MPTFFERSCDNCRRLKIRCDRMKPCCKNCNKRQVSCTRNKPLQKRGPKPKHSSSTGSSKHAESSSFKGSSSAGHHPARQQKLKLLLGARNPKDPLIMDRFSCPKDSLAGTPTTNLLDSPLMSEPHQYSDYSDNFPAEEYDDDFTTSSGGESFSDDGMDQFIHDEEEGEVVGSGVYSSDESFMENPTTPDSGFLHDQVPATQEATWCVARLSSQKQLLSLSGGCQPTLNCCMYSDVGSKIDTPHTVNTTIQNDLARFEKTLQKAVPELLSQHQVEYLSYYFSNIQPQLPIISQQRFLNLLAYQRTPTISSPSELSCSSKGSGESPSTQLHFSYQANLKMLISALCQVAYLFALNPSLFQHSIMSFLVQSNLDILFSGEAALPKLPGILTNALTMLMRCHLGTTTI